MAYDWVCHIKKAAKCPFPMIHSQTWRPSCSLRNGSADQICSNYPQLMFGFRANPRNPVWITCCLWHMSSHIPTHSQPRRLRFADKNTKTPLSTTLGSFINSWPNQPTWSPHEALWQLFDLVTGRASFTCPPVKKQIDPGRWGLEDSFPLKLGDFQGLG